MVEIIADVLGDMGYEVRAAGDGQQGLEAARQKVPDLIVLDMSMPVMDGYAVARSLRAEAATRSVPIIAVTGEASQLGYDAAYGAGCNAFVAKPLDVAVLAQRVRDVLSGG
jgi:CheY-like chemotaxis protein